MDQVTPQVRPAAVVAGLDGSREAHAAAGWAAADALRRGIPLRLVHAIEPEVTGGYPAPLLTHSTITESLRKHARHLLSTCAAQLTAEHPGLQIDEVPLDGSPVAVLIAESRDAVLTVVGSHGSGQLSQAIFGSVAARLAAHGHGAVVVVHPLPGPDALATGGPVIVGVDGSAQSAAVLGLAFEEADLRGVPLVAIHTWNDKPLEHALGSYPLSVNATAIDTEELRLLAEEISGFQQKYPAVTVHPLVLHGRPARTLLHYAAGGGHSPDQDGPGLGPAQLLVVGSRGHGGFVGLLLGSTSQALVAHAGCPVAIVRDPVSHRATLTG